MFRVFLAGWLVALLEMGCAGVTRGGPQGAPADSAGSPADAPADEPSAPGVARRDCACADANLAWWRAGTGPRRAESSISDCRVYSNRSRELDSRWTSCSRELSTCGERFDVDDLNRGLADRDVLTALAQAPVLFGADPRPRGGEVDHIEVEGRIIELGNDCADDPRCAIPPGVAALDQLLGHIELFQLPQASCTESV